jgi:DNA topoisomerase-1
LQRIRKLAIPPAYRDVWIASDPKAHLQATGKDARGRTQYRYHPSFREVRELQKYQRILEFAKALPKIRRRVARDLRKKGLERDRVLAAVVRLLEKTLIRIGSEEYAKGNDSYGLTTLRNHHVKAGREKLHFEFKGKSNIRHSIRVSDPKIANIVRKCQDLPGKDLFEYIDEKGRTHDVKSQDVNRYIGDAAGRSFTAKDFRTWKGTVLAYRYLRNSLRGETQTERKRTIKLAIAQVAERLGNTSAICRKCYIHPSVLEAFLGGNWDAPRSRAKLSKTKEEAEVFAFLEKNLKRRNS